MIVHLPLITLCCAFTGSVSAIRIPFRRDAAHSTTVKFTSKSSAGFNFTNNNNAMYEGTIFLNGHPFQVDLDTGSSDLWLDTSGFDLSGLTNTSIHGFIQYVDLTAAEGPILLGNVTFGDFTVGQQAFISAPGSNSTALGRQGILGIGPPLLSAVAHKLSSTKFNGNSFLDNVFSAYPAEPNFMAFHLSRSATGISNGGIFTIVVGSPGEIPDEFSAIQDTSPIEVITKTNRWTVKLDAVIIGGQRHSGHGTHPGSENVNTAILDSGASPVLAPPYYVDAMYKSIDGAEFVQEYGGYVVPCDTRIDIGIVIANTTFPVNPIDLTLPVLVNGTVYCVGTFRYTDPSDDFLLGDPFLRNVFALYDFGNWTTVGDSAPFIKLLSVTNATQADSEFDTSNKARLEAVTNNSTSGTDNTSGTDPTPSTGSTPSDGSKPTSGSTASGYNPPGGESTPSPSGIPDVDGTKKVTSGDLLADTDNSGATTVDLGPLMRNSYIIIGLLSVVIITIIVGTVVLRGNKSYRAVPTSERLGEYVNPSAYDAPFNIHKD